MAFTVSSGQVTSSAALSGSGGTLDSGTVLFGGSAIATSVGAGGVLTVQRGGFVSNTMVHSRHAGGGKVVLMAGALAEGATIDQRGELIVSSGALAVSVNAQGLVMDSGELLDGFVAAAGTGHNGLRVLQGGSAVNMQLEAGTMDVTSGGVAVDTDMSGGELDIAGGGLANSVYAEAGNIIIDGRGILSSLYDSGYMASSFGRTYTVAANVTVQTGGIITGLDLALGGNVQNFSHIADALVSNGGSLFINSGGATTGTTVGTLGTETVSAQGVASDTVLSFFGRQNVLSGGTAVGTVVSNGGQLVVESGGKLKAPTLVGGGLVSLGAGALDATTISFVSSGGVVAWGGAGPLGATLSGFGPGDTIDLTALTYVSGGTATLHGLHLFVTEAGTTDTIAFASGISFSSDSFVLGNDGVGSTAVTLVSAGGAVTLAPARG